MLLRDLFDDFPLNGSGVVPLELQQLLKTPLNIADDWERVEHLLLQAREKMPDRLEITVALYKMYAYSNHLDESLGLINEVLCKSATAGGFTINWCWVSQDSADWQNAVGPVRFYLYSMKAMGFVLLRRGDPETAYQVLKKLQELDPRDQVGGSVVREMAERILEIDSEEELEHVA